MSTPLASYHPLTNWERRMILRLLESPFPGRDALLTQLDDTTGCSVHEDGTPLDESGTVYLKCASAVKASVKARIPTEGEALDTDGVIIHYLLHVVDGRMNELEVFKEDSSRVLRHAGPEDLKVINVGCWRSDSFIVLKDVGPMKVSTVSFPPKTAEFGGFVRLAADRFCGAGRPRAGSMERSGEILQTRYMNSSPRSV